MSVTNKNFNERSNVEENKVLDERDIHSDVLFLPEDVIENAKFTNDIVDKAEDETEEVTSFETFENEEGYKSNYVVSKEAENRIDAFSRDMDRRFGKKVLGLGIFSSSYKEAEYERAA